MKKGFDLILRVVLAVITVYIVIDNYYVIVNSAEYVYKRFLQPGIKQTLIDNKYKKNVDYGYVQINTDTEIKNKDDLKNAIYTFLDAGWSSYTVQCDIDYLDCLSDVQKMVEDTTYLTDISNFVHPFNTFNRVNTTFSSTGRITLNVEKKYTDEQIKIISQKVDEVYNKYYKPNKSTKENIKIFHNYIVNNTKYDSSNTTGNNDIASSTAFGVAILGSGICSGYSEMMSLFLEKLNVKNYRISSDSHMWNLAYVDNEWLHIDVTWDDPVRTDGKNSLSTSYLLINSEKLNKLTNEEHTYNPEIYLELK